MKQERQRRRFIKRIESKNSSRAFDSLESIDGCVAFLKEMSQKGESTLILKNPERFKKENL